MEVWEAGTTREILTAYKEESFHCNGGQTAEAQAGSVISFLRDTQTVVGLGPELHALSSNQTCFEQEVGPGSFHQSLPTHRIL